MLPKPAPISSTREPEGAAKAIREPAVVGLELGHAGQRDVPDVLGILRLPHRVAHDRPEGRDGVLPADLLAFLVGAPVVRDRHLVDPVAAPRDLRRDLGLEAEAVRLDGDRLDDLAAKHLVAGLHVGEVQVGEHVGGERQETVADRVPEVEDAASAAAQEARAVHDVGVALGDRGEQLEVLHRVVFEVGVLHDHDVAGRVAESRPRRRRPCPG